MTAHQKQLLAVVCRVRLPDIRVLLGSILKFIQAFALQALFGVGCCIEYITLTWLEVLALLPVAGSQYLCLVFCRTCKLAVDSTITFCRFEHFKVKRRQSFFMKILFFLYSCGLQVVDHGSHAQLLCSRTVSQFVFS